MGIYEDVAALQTQMTEVQSDITNLETNINDLETDVNSLGIIELTSGTDLHILTEGTYLIPNATVCETLLNKPDGVGNSTGIVNVVKGGDEGQLTMYYITCSKTATTYYQKAYYGDSWGDWRIVHNTYTDWLELPLATGIGKHDVTSFPCQYRKIGNVVYVRGCINGFSDVQKVVATLPVGHRPSKSFYQLNATNGGKVDTFNYRSNGNIERVATTLPTLSTDNYHFINAQFLVD